MTKAATSRAAPNHLATACPTGTPRGEWRATASAVVRPRPDRAQHDQQACQRHEPVQESRRQLERRCADRTQHRAEGEGRPGQAVGRQRQAEPAEEDRDDGNAEIDELVVEGQALADVVGAEADDEDAERRPPPARSGPRPSDGVADAAPSPQTFSISGLPSSPVGRKISTRTRMANTATSLYSLEK